MILTGQIHAYGYIGTDYNLALLNGTSPPGTSRRRACAVTQRSARTRASAITLSTPGANATDQPPDTITQENITLAAVHGHAGRGHDPTGLRRFLKHAGREPSHHDAANRLNTSRLTTRALAQSRRIAWPHSSLRKRVGTELQTRGRVHWRAFGSSRRHLHAGRNRK